MNEQESEIVLVDDEGQEHKFTLYRVIEIDDASYALLEPEDAEGELVILRLEGEGDDQVLVTLDDDEWDRVTAALDGIEDL